jgi:ABC-type oligopeptide transport system ATPase subunit
LEEKTIKITQLGNKIFKKIKEKKKDEETKNLIKRVEKLEEKNKPKTAFEIEKDKVKKWLYED